MPREPVQDKKPEQSWKEPHPHREKKARQESVRILPVIKGDQAFLRQRKNYGQRPHGAWLLYTFISDGSSIQHISKDRDEKKKSQLDQIHYFPTEERLSCRTDRRERSAHHTHYLTSPHTRSSPAASQMPTLCCLTPPLLSTRLDLPDLKTMVAANGMDPVTTDMDMCSD